MVKNKILILLAAMVVAVPAAFSEYRKLPNGKLRMVFCDVGQGDAAYIKTPSGKDILIDGGPNDKVLTCLSNHMNFWNRRLELVVLTHPQADHATGLLSVLKQYDVDTFILGPEGNKSEIWRQIEKKLTSQRQVKIANPSRGDVLKTGDGVEFTVLWPTAEYLASNTFGGQNLPGGAVLGASTDRDLNSFSLVLELQYKNYRALFTGDIDPSTLLGASLPDVDLVKIPHHGSKTGLTEKFYSQTQPETAVISVGAGNKFGHPAPETVSLLEKFGIKIRRTDLEGEIKF